MVTGTHKFLDMIGFDDDIKLAVTEVSVKYIAPLKVPNYSLFLDSQISQIYRDL